jgi:hypothetical protein
MLAPARTGTAAVARRDRASWPFGLEAETWLVIAIVVLAAVLRFAMISSQSYWLDESQAVHELHLSFTGMLSAWSSWEWNPPLYLLIAWPWAKVFGTGEVGLRALSAVLGTAVVPLIYLSGRELVSRRAGLVAAAFAAVNPFMIWYSQEAREYMLLVLCCAASLLFFARAWRTRSTRDIVWWTVFSVLALLTQYFAGFLIAAEGLLLVYRLRNRVSVIALATMGVVELALIPHVTPRLDQPVQFIVSLPLSLRLQQVPVTFGMNTLYQSGIVSYGLIGAAVLAAAVIALLVIGASERELRGAGLAALLAAAVLLVPLLLALLGHDDYIARGLMPGWLPLAIVIAAACTASGTRIAGGALAAVLIAMFVYAGIRIDNDAQFQRPNWRGVAAALGRPVGRRAIVAYDGVFATGPLSVYLHGVPWSGPGMPRQTATPVTVSEVDIVGSTTQRLSTLPAGTRLLASRAVDGYQVDRFGLRHPWSLSPAAIGVRATALLGPAPPSPVVMIQPAGATKLPSP